jgi:hypothetical protein
MELFAVDDNRIKEIEVYFGFVPKEAACGYERSQ